jgi:hypothetical protein
LAYEAKFAEARVCAWADAPRAMADRATARSGIVRTMMWLREGRETKSGERDASPRKGVPEARSVNRRGQN